MWKSNNFSSILRVFNKFWSLVSQKENILVRSVLLELFDPEEG